MASQQNLHFDFNIFSLKKNTQQSSYQCSSLFEFSLLKDCKFILFLFNNILWNIGSLILFNVITDYAIYHGIEKDRSAYLLSCIGFCNFFGRLLVAFVAIHKSCNRLAIFVISTAVTGITIAVFPLSHDYVTLMVLSGIYGLFFGIQLGVLAVVTVELFGVHRLTSAYGYLMFGNGAGALIGPPLAGKESLLSFTSFLFSLGNISPRPRLERLRGGGGGG